MSLRCRLRGEDTMFIFGCLEHEVAQIALKAKSGHYPVDGRLQAVFQALRRLEDVWKCIEIGRNPWEIHRKPREIGPNRAEIGVFEEPRRSGTATSRTASRRRNRNSAPWWTGSATSTAPARGKALKGYIMVYVIAYTHTIQYECSITRNACNCVVPYEYL